MFHNIIHISDIHIRNGDEIKSRYTEYMNQSLRLFESISHQPSIQDKSAIIVITGDLFHYKNKIEPYSLELAIKLLQGLSLLAPVYIIRGNHDYRQDLPKERDMISALMSYTIPNVTYLDQTGLYEVQNITLGMVAIQDTLLYGSTSGITSDLPPFPRPLKNGSYRVALFHGSITGSTLQNGSPIDSTLHGYPIDWFQGYDAILLGDIHVQQIKRANPIDYDESSTIHTIPYTSHSQTYHYTDTVPWGYAGSLIQQDFGESLYGHGYLVWNLKDHLIHTYHLSNSTGLVKLRYSEGTLQILHRHPTTHAPLFVPIDDVIDQDWFPHDLTISIIGEHVDHKIITQYFEMRKKHILNMKLPLLTPSPKQTTVVENIHEIHSIDVLIHYIQNALDGMNLSLPDLWKSWLKTSDLMLLHAEHLPDSLIQKIKDKTEKLRKVIAIYQSDFERVRSTSLHTGTIQLHSLEWSWLLNYNQGNRFDFDAHTHQISILNAKNASGKSNFLEIICIALYGEGFPSRYNKNYSSSMICDKKPAGVMANTLLSFSMDDKHYTLKRVLKCNNDKRAIASFEVILTENDTILHQGQNAVSIWIESHIGSITTYLMSSMLSQNADSDFFSLDKPSQKKLLDQLLSLQHIQSLQNLLHESTKYYKYIMELIETYQTGLTQITVPIGTTEKVLHLKDELQHLLSLKDATHAQWSILPEKTLSSVNLEQIQSEHDDLLCQISSLPPSNETDNLHSMLHSVQSRLTHIENELTRYHSFSDLSTTGLDPLDLLHVTDLIQNHVHSTQTAVNTHPYYSSSSHSIYEDSTTISQKISSIHTDSIQAQIESATQTLFDMKQKRDLKSTEKEQLLQQRPNRPHTDPAWIHSMKRNIKHQGSLSVILERYNHLLLCSQQIPLLCKDITTLQNKINEYESYLDNCEIIPFNPSCDSCAKQSWKITYDRYDQELPSLQNTLQTLHTRIQSYQSPLIQTPLVYSDHEPYLASLLLLMTSTERYLESLKRYETEKVLHTAYDKWFTAYTLIATQLDDMNRAYDICEAERREAERIRTEKELEHSWYNSLHRFRSAVAVYNTHLLTEHAALIEKHDYLQSLLRKETLCQQLHNVQRILTAYPAWIQWKEQCNTAADISLRIREFEVMLRYGSSTLLTPSPLLLSERAKQYLQITTTLSGLFGSYRKWIYTTHIAPLIHSRVNHVLSTICDQIHFESEWLDTIDSLSWFIRDGTSRVVLEKSSGFQRFIVGIAMRVALRDIGLSRIQYSDLFIDEGFTACDVDHLEKVPSFLQGLLHFYKSIYLVTHLEDLKACSPHHIYISRDANGLAHIQSTDNPTSTHVVSIPIKKRGRPPKKSKTNHTPAASPSNDPSS